MREAKEKYTHNVTLTAEIENRLRVQREAGRTIVSLLILGIGEAEKHGKK